ncbi:gas vesicle protein K [Kutzneria buriramensis]|uniref:Gas vesicle protein GvpK n=1 Tax=Kutzneria buriramensis TaxID=1045776 RepID=A0A3E0HHS6_9PSEU|nr:gas vesicle protein K [Kutzneria buriramensis]REH46001.1 gas vesicle protein GvpK [Kutzneria buriramensis]
MTAPPRRFDVDAGRGLGRLVVAVLDILRELIERQVLRRVDAGTLTPDEIERLGRALLELDRQFRELRTIFDDGGSA